MHKHMNCEVHNNNKSMHFRELCVVVVVVFSLYRVSAKHDLVSTSLIFFSCSSVAFLYAAYTVSFRSTDACEHQIHLYTNIETMNDQKMNNLSIDLPYLLLQYMQIMFYALVIIMNEYEHNNQIRKEEKKNAHIMMNIFFSPAFAGARIHWSSLLMIFMLMQCVLLLCMCVNLTGYEYFVKFSCAKIRLCHRQILVRLLLAVVWCVRSSHILVKSTRQPSNNNKNPQKMEMTKLISDRYQRNGRMWTQSKNEWIMTT